MINHEFPLKTSSFITIHVLYTWFIFSCTPDSNADREAERIFCELSTNHALAWATERRDMPFFRMKECCSWGTPTDAPCSWTARHCSMQRERERERDWTAERSGSFFVYFFKGLHSFWDKECNPFCIYGYRRVQSGVSDQRRGPHILQQRGDSAWNCPRKLLPVWVFWLC